MSTDNQRLAKLAGTVMRYDYGAPGAVAVVEEGTAVPEEKPVAAPTMARDPFEADFGQDPGFHPAFPQPPASPAAYFQHPAQAAHAAQTAVHVHTEQRSLLLDFFLQTLAVVAGGYAVQRFIVPRMPPHRGGLAD